MIKRRARRYNKREFPGKDITFGKMWLAVPYASLFQTGMDITCRRASDTEGRYDG